MDIISVIESYGITVIRAGELHKSICPFHADRNPSMIIYEKTQSFYCFSCKASGDVYNFISRKEGISLTEVRSKYKTQFIKHKLNKLAQPKVIEFNDELHSMVASITRDYLYKNPEKSEQVLYILSKLDKQILGDEIIEYTTAMKFVNKYRTYLSKLGGAHVCSKSNNN